MIAGTAQKTKIPNFRLMSIRVEPPLIISNYYKKSKENT